MANVTDETLQHMAEALCLERELWELVKELQRSARDEVLHCHGQHAEAQSYFFGRGKSYRKAAEALIEVLERHRM